MVPLRVWIASVGALVASIYALQPDSAATATTATHATSVSFLDSGNMYALLAAFFLSATKVRLSDHLRLQNSLELSSYRLLAQFVFAVAGFALLALPEVRGQNSNAEDVSIIGHLPGLITGIPLDQLCLLVISSLLSGTLATQLQAEAQKVVPAPEAQIVYSLTPLFASGWALLLLHEHISDHEVFAGAALLVIALASAATSLDVTAAEKATPAKTQEENQVALKTEVETEALAPVLQLGEESKKGIKM